MSANVAIRIIRRDDEDRLCRLFYRLSPESVYRRFFTLYSHPPAGVLRALTDLDHDQRDAVVAVVGDEVVGVARYAAVRGRPGEAEVAVVVDDAWQRQGIGLRLMTCAARLAQLHGMTVLSASVLAENLPAIAMLHAAAPDAAWVPNGSEYDVRIPLSAWRKSA